MEDVPVKRAMNDALVVEEALKNDNDALKNALDVKEDEKSATLAMNDALVAEEALEDENDTRNQERGQRDGDERKCNRWCGSCEREEVSSGRSL